MHNIEGQSMRPRKCGRLFAIIGYVGSSRLVAASLGPHEKNGLHSKNAAPAYGLKEAQKLRKIRLKDLRWHLESRSAGLHTSSTLW
jgi:hypothetical protein